MFSWWSSQIGGVLLVSLIKLIKLIHDLCQISKHYKSTSNIDWSCFLSTVLNMVPYLYPRFFLTPIYFTTGCEVWVDKVKGRVIKVTWYCELLHLPCSYLSRGSFSHKARVLVLFSHLLDLLRFAARFIMQAKCLLQKVWNCVHSTLINTWWVWKTIYKVNWWIRGIMPVVDFEELL